LDDPVAIRSLKRFVADWYFENVNEHPEPFSVTHTQRAAVVGAGPTGLSCAYFLAKMGYPVTVFEALPVGGGMLSVALPEFRLPREMIQKEIDYIASRGVDIRYDTPVNSNFTLEHIRKQGYEAIFIAAGAQRSQRIGIPGELEDVAGFHYGLRFLRDVRLGKETRIGRRAAVIGGGNVALDAARTALRLGADEVNVYYRRTRQEMPVTDVEYDHAVDEGINMNFLCSPTRIVSQNWQVNGLQCIRMTLGEIDDGGRRRPVPLAGSEFFAGADTVIAAVGQAPDLSFLPPDSALERTRWETLAVNNNNMATNLPGVFAGGDFVTGPAMVIEAIAGGRRAAIAMDKYLRGDASRVEIFDLKRTAPGDQAAAGPAQDTEEAWEAKPRLTLPLLSPLQRKKCFAEIELPFSDDVARREATRCLRCDLEQ
jgi:NADH-quinone oxidoreductase subunit F